MRIFVASIHSSEFDRKNVSVADKTKIAMSHLDAIYKDAMKELGEDALVVVVMQEYAFTPKAIPIAEKNASLAAFQHAVKNFKNMIFIPGSFAAYDDLDDEQRRADKTKKMLANFRSLSQSKLVHLSEYEDEQDVVLRKSKSGELKRSVFMQNCSYILTADAKLKHKKAAPWNETKKLHDSVTNGIYYIGADHPVKNIEVNGNNFKLGLLICREHEGVAPIAFTTSEDNPLIQVIVSDSISTDQNKLYGALNIHMDSLRGLSVFYNSSHREAAEITSVRSYQYHLNKDSTFKLPVETTFISHPIALTKPEAQKKLKLKLKLKFFAPKRDPDSKVEDLHDRKQKVRKMN